MTRKIAFVTGGAGFIAGQEPAIGDVPMPPAIRSRRRYLTEARMERLAAAGYAHPMTPLEDGVEDYVVRHLSQPDACR